MSRRWRLASLMAILLLAATLRLSYLNWDDYNHYHPDERYISWVAVSIGLPKDISTAFKPHESTFNPFYWPADPEPAGVLLISDEPRTFAYGHVPLYFGVIANRLLSEVGARLSPYLPANWSLTQDILNGVGANRYDHLTVSGRALTALVDVASVALVYFIGKWLFRPSVGLLAAAFLALNVMHIQLAHFFTVDPYLTFFVLLTIAALLQSINKQNSQRKRLVFLLVGAAMIGLAVGSKFTGILLLLPLGAALTLDGERSYRQKGFLLLATLTLIVISFIITNPFALLDATCEPGQPEKIGPLKVPDLVRSSCYLQNVISQGSMVRGTRDVPYVRQYEGTTPFLYFVEMQIKWGMGPALGVLAFAGFCWAIWRGYRAFLQWLRVVIGRISVGDGDSFPEVVSPWERISRGELLVLAWTVPFFISTGSLEVKFMRYLMPLTPFLMVYGAAMILAWSKIAWRQLLLGMILTLTALYVAAFMNIYREPHPWISASKWIFGHVEPGSTILYEAWDDALPDSVKLGGEDRSRDEYEAERVNWLTGTEVYDNEEKLVTNLELVSDSEYVILSSNRNYGVIPRLRDRYPLSSQYYQMLFDGTLGFEQVYTGTRIPNVFGVYLKPDPFGWSGLDAPDGARDYFDSLPGPNWGRFDESFTVYDQPMPMIFRNIGRLSREEMRALFSG